MKEIKDDTVRWTDVLYSQIGRVNIVKNIYTTGRVTGRKARRLQTEEIACKCQTFLSLLSSRRKQTSDIFFFSIQI